jgi:hypothetical protein
MFWCSAMLMLFLRRDQPDILRKSKMRFDETLALALQLQGKLLSGIELVCWREKGMERTKEALTVKLKKVAWSTTSELEVLHGFDVQCVR